MGTHRFEFERALALRPQVAVDREVTDTGCHACAGSRAIDADTEGETVSSLVLYATRVRRLSGAWRVALWAGQR